MPENTVITPSMELQRAKRLLEKGDFQAAEKAYERALTFTKLFYDKHYQEAYKKFSATSELKNSA